MIISSEYLSDEYLHLNSCGIKFLCDKDYSTLRKNGRVDYHILYIAKGKCITDGQAAPEGSVILFYPNEKQNYRFYKEDESISCYIHFSGTGCGEILKNVGLTKRITNIGKSKTLEYLFERLTAEYSLKKPFYNYICTGYLTEILGIIGRKNEFLKNRIYAKNKSDIDEVCLLMLKEYSKNRPLSFYADSLKLSVSRFSHIFKSAIGKTPLMYITEIRISKAKELLLNTNLTMGEIAELTGFSSQNYFIRVFKKHTGISPKRYASQG